MNYIRIYDSIIATARSRMSVSPCEKHHVIPKCLGGKDTKENIVKLTPREHFIVHQLLTKMHPENHGLAFAAYFMSKKGTHGSRHYEWLKKQFSERQSAALKGKPRPEHVIKAWHAKAHQPLSKERKEWLSLINRGKKLTEEHKAKLIAANTGRAMTEAQKAALSERTKGKKYGLGNKSRTGMRNRPETLLKISIANKGRKQTDEWQKNKADGLRKVNDFIISEIRGMYKSSKISQLKIAQKFGLSQSHVGRIIRGEYYKSGKAEFTPKSEGVNNG